MTVSTETRYFNDEGGIASIEYDDVYDPDSPNVDRTDIYNANGDLERTEFDGTGNGLVDRSVFYAPDGATVIRTETHTYDTLGRLVRTEFDGFEATDTEAATPVDGNVDRAEAYFYDANGNLERTEFDDEYDPGNPNVDRIEAYFYDANGNLERTEFDDVYDPDNPNVDRSAFFNDDGDEIADRTEAYTYDGRGRLRSTEFDDEYDPANLNVDRIEYYFYDADRNLVRTEFDGFEATDTEAAVPADGSRDRAEAYFYNANGNLEHTDFDDGNNNKVDSRHFHNANDGTVIRTEAYTYDGQGRLGSTAFDDVYDPDNPNVDRTETYTYDDEGRLAQTHFDAGDDGSVEEISVRTYSEVLEGDGAGNLVVTVNYYDGDDIAPANHTLTETHTYDGPTADSNVIHTTFDDDANGLVDRRDSYNDDGDVTFTEVYDANGEVIRTETYVYDANGNLVSTDFDGGADGDADGRVDSREIDTDGDQSADQTLTFEYEEDVFEGNDVDILENGIKVLRGFDDIDGNEHDGQLDRLNFVNTDTFEFRLTESDAQGAQGLKFITLSNSGDSTLVLSDGVYSIIADGDTGHVVQINGGTDDVVELTGNWIEDTSDNDPANREYVSDEGYTVSINIDNVDGVIITDDPFAL